MQIHNISPMSGRNGVKPVKQRGFGNMNAILVISHHSTVLLGSLMKEWIDLNSILLERWGFEELN